MTREIGKPEKAIQLYTGAIQMTDEEELHCEAWIGIAACNRWMGKGEESAEVLEKQRGLQNRVSFIYGSRKLVIIEEVIYSPRMN